MTPRRKAHHNSHCASPRHVFVFCSGDYSTSKTHPPYNFREENKLSPTRRKVATPVSNWNAVALNNPYNFITRLS